MLEQQIESVIALLGFCRDSPACTLCVLILCSVVAGGVVLEVFARVESLRELESPGELESLRELESEE